MTVRGLLKKIVDDVKTAMLGIAMLLGALAALYFGLLALNWIYHSSDPPAYIEQKKYEIVYKCRDLDMKTRLEILDRMKDEKDYAQLLRLEQMIDQELRKQR